MSGESDRDQSIEQLLRRGVRGATAPAPTACLDAETLAAWADRTLSSYQAAQVEHHVSDCARCQAILAVFERTEPPKPAGADRRHWLWWMIPIAAGSIAAAGLFWIAWPTATRPPASQSARVEQPAAMPPVSPTVLPPKASTGEAAAARTPAAPASSPRQIAEPRRPTSSNSAAIDSVSAVRPKVQPAPASPAPAVPPPGPPPVNAPQPAPTPTRALVPPLPQASASPAAPPPAGASLEKSSAGSVQDSPQRNVTETRPGVAGARADQAAAMRPVPMILSEFVGTDQGPAARPVAVGGQGRAGAGRATGPVRWRIFATGNVERSMTGGASWEPIAIDAPAFVYAGDAPSSLVCWLVGRDGLVLRSVDGLHFERLNVPDSVNLVSVRALDASRATVTTTDGRAYATTDGGLSWQSRLQDFPTSPF